MSDETLSALAACAFIISLMAVIGLAWVEVFAPAMIDMMGVQ